MRFWKSIATNGVLIAFGSACVLLAKFGYKFEAIIIETIISVSPFVAATFVWVK